MPREKEKPTGGCIRPPEERRKNLPPLRAKVVLGVAAGKVPDVALNFVGPWAVPTRIVDVGAEESIKSVLFEAADGATEEARADEEQKIGHDDEEDSEGCVEGIRYGQDNKGLKEVPLRLANW